MGKKKQTTTNVTCQTKLKATNLSKVTLAGLVMLINNQDNNVEG